MGLEWIWKTALIVLIGTLLLRIAGRKTIAQMTITQAMLMIAIGTLLIQPVVGKNVWLTFATGAVLVLTLIGIEYGQLKSDKFEQLITGQAKILIENGKLNEKNMAKLRMTVDQLEMKLRQKNVTKISDVEWATLEPTGHLGFTLKKEAQPVTKGEFQQVKQSLDTILNNQAQFQPLNYQQSYEENIFTEVKQKNMNFPHQNIYNEVFPYLNENS